MPMKKKQSGLALIELAISLSVLTTIAFGITEFGRAIYQYNTLVKAARDGVRFLAVRDPSAVGTLAEARCVVVYGNPSCSGQALASNLAVDMVSVCHAMDPACAATHQAQGASPVINLVTVTIGATTPYVFQSLASFVVPDIQFGAISATMRQVL
jgi:Flp pilus assembly protein TadG